MNGEDTVIAGMVKAAAALVTIGAVAMSATAAPAQVRHAGYHRAGGYYRYGRAYGGWGGYYRYGRRWPGRYWGGYYGAYWPWFWGGWPYLRPHYYGYGYPYYYGYGYPYYYGYSYYDTPPPSAPEPAPRAAAPPRPEPEAHESKAFIVYFPFDESILTPAAQRVVEDAARYANDRHATRVTVVGHADASGGVEYNQRLSERRASVMQRALVNLGVPESVLALDWRGKSDLAVPTPDGVREPLNRRSTIDIQSSG